MDAPKLLSTRPTEILTPVVVTLIVVVGVLWDVPARAIFPAAVAVGVIAPWLITIVNDAVDRRNDTPQETTKTRLRDRPTEVGTTIVMAVAAVAIATFDTYKIGVGFVVVASGVIPALISWIARSSADASEDVMTYGKRPSLDNPYVVMRELATLKRVVPDAGDVLDLVQGNRRVAGLLAVTREDGVLFIAERALARRMEWFSYDELSSVRAQAGLFFGTLELGLRDGSTRLTRIVPKKAVGDVACRIRKGIRAQQASGAEHQSAS